MRMVKLTEVLPDEGESGSIRAEVWVNADHVKSVTPQTTKEHRWGATSYVEMAGSHSDVPLTAEGTPSDIVALLVGSNDPVDWSDMDYIRLLAHGWATDQISTDAALECIRNRLVGEGAA